MLILVSGLLTSSIFAYLNGVIKPILYRECEAYAKTLLTEIVSLSLADDKANTYFDNTMNFTYNNDGYISSYSLNMLNANKIRAFIVEDVIAEIKARSALKLNVSAGTLSGFAFFYGKGPKVRVDLTALYGISCDLTSEFTDSGINQTLHRMSLEFTANTSVKEPLTSDKMILKASVPISETVIVGDIPDAYTFILHADEEDENMINDYGAKLD